MELIEREVYKRSADPNGYDSYNDYDDYNDYGHGYGGYGDKLTLQTNTGRLNINLETNLIQNPRVQRLKPPPVMTESISSTGRHKWLTVWANSISDVVYGRLLTSSHYNNSIPTMYLEHWTPIPGINRDNNTTPQISTQYFTTL
ncbi:hypothetical protein RhiirA4_478700 [Rhizophagus irregularis]|uniref:Uncharacterized protein n=1 Tax=Rhizophagus irregularis TaxID=588596 RepID=A0A2I1HF85_9GLOM|nr:hypothetical protein RhiirA4_478700 [Rhizophagus irregularis]